MTDAATTRLDPLAKKKRRTPAPAAPAPASSDRPARPPRLLRRALGRVFGLQLFPRLIGLTLVGAIALCGYWGFGASDRYVSEARVIIRKTDSAASPSPDFAMIFAGIAGVNRIDQLLLREYLLSVDMLRQLDEAFDLRAHYSDRQRDLLSRLWRRDIEWFHRHYLSRVSIEYDDYTGILRIRAQAYDPETAHGIADLLVREGERYMNQISHELTETQVSFLTLQAQAAQERFQEASQVLLAFQNRKGLLSPEAAAESLNIVIGRLEEQRARIQTQLASLPRALDADHPHLVMLRQALEAVDGQIDDERAKLANPSGETLNITLEEFARLQMEMTFTQELYKAALTALEKGRIDAARMLEKVSVLQTPTRPEYPMEPRRIYNTIVTLIFALMIAGILKLLERIIRDHVD